MKLGVIRSYQGTALEPSQRWLLESLERKATVIVALLAFAPWLGVHTISAGLLPTIAVSCVET
jgi:hypothetical protein